MDEFTSLHCTLLIMHPRRSLCDFMSDRFHWTRLHQMPPALWVGLLPWPCWCAPPPPLYFFLFHGMWRSGSWSMPTTNYSYISVMLIKCVVNMSRCSFCKHDIYCIRPSWRRILLLLLSSRFLHFFPQWKGFFYFVGVIRPLLLYSCISFSLVPLISW